MLSKDKIKIIMHSLKSRYMVLTILVALFIFGNHNVSFADLDYCNPPKLTPDEAKQSLDPNDVLIQKYIDIWKKLIKEKNDLNDADIAKHVYVFWAYGSKDKPSSDISIHYYVNIEWFHALETVHLTVLLRSTDDNYKYLNLKRDVYLSEEDIRVLVERAHSPQIMKINVRQPLLYSNMDAAIADLNKFAGPGVFKIGTTRLRCGVTSDGDPTVSAFAALDSNKNKCINGYVNLRTGEAKFDKRPCRVE